MKPMYVQSESSSQAILNHLKELAPHSPITGLWYRIHPDFRTVEYMIGEELAPELDLTLLPEERARRFLLNHCELFGLIKESLAQQLFLKHVNKSRIGTHCIFDLRLDFELVEQSLVVHLDPGNRIIMVTCVCLPTDALGLESSKQILTSGEIQEVVRKMIPAALAKNNLTLKGLVRAEWMRLAVPSADGKHVFQCALQIKLTTQNNKPIVGYVLIKNGKADFAKLIDISANIYASRIGLAKIFRDYWFPSNPNLELDSADILKPHADTVESIVLRDLQSDADLTGRYVSVKDDISDIFTRSNHHYDALNQNEEPAMFDRVMAYYHIDLAQRYFRDLGLDVLDSYDSLNPIRVVLSLPGGNEVNETGYNSGDNRIYVTPLDNSDFSEYTDARQPRILYHEFVHAVTDQLARLHRSGRRKGKEIEDDPWGMQALQAVAMSEGLADYFACSIVAAREPKREASFYFLRVRDGENGKGKTLTWNLERTLERPAWDQENNFRIEHVDYDFKTEDQQMAKLNELDVPEIRPLIYQMGTQWARFLWRLRDKLGAQVADRIIAHSILFLTRWSSFGQGILALKLADRLLFEGTHSDQILSERPKEGQNGRWDNWSNESDLNSSHFARTTKA